ncbi:MAG: uracil-xanthine permease [Clostridia bacterium]|nr:uracil-xanthine permease [Clostridia bacterium]
MKLVYNVDAKPRDIGYGKVAVFALQQMLAILAATIAVPAIIGNGMSQSAALFGAGVGTLVYLLFTRFKSPVFLGSSFAFLGSMGVAFAGAYANTVAGYTGLLLGAIFAGLVYVAIALITKFAGVKWISKLMPAVVVGPTVAIIGLSLAGNAVKDAVGGTNGLNYVSWNADSSSWIMNTKGVLCLVCALITLATVIFCSVFGKKMMKMIPFILGILAGYIVATILTVIGIATNNETLQLVNFSLFKTMDWVPDFTFIKAFKGFRDLTPAYFGTIAVAYIPVAFVVFAEHLADHKNISSIIEKDLLEDPGLSNTLLGDGVGSIAGAFFGGCPNTTYGESIGCVAISGNASVVTIFVTACMAIIASFLAPFVTFLATIPSCVMGGVCISLYGFIAVSGLKMIQKADLGDNRNLFTVSVILITGIGGMALTFGKVTITSIACALIHGILTNLLLNCGKKADAKTSDEEETEKVASEKTDDAE